LKGREKMLTMMVMHSVFCIIPSSISDLTPM
jgi:hypothetical protein